MTPEEAAGFYEEDEDPAEVFARFDAGPHGFTGYARGGIVARPPEGSGEVPFPITRCHYPRALAAGQVRKWRDYIRATYGPGASQ